MRRIRSGNRKAKNKTNRLVIAAAVVMQGEIVGTITYYVKAWQRKQLNAMGVDIKQDIINIFNNREPDTSDIPESNEEWFKKAELRND
jgi:hypothetical protein